MTGADADPDAAAGPDEAAFAPLLAWAREHLPGVEPRVASAGTCLYTTSPTADFVLERRGAVTAVSACSGHGFSRAARRRRGRRAGARREPAGAASPRWVATRPWLLPASPTTSSPAWPLGRHRYFGYPGDGINGLTSALQRAASAPSSSRSATRRPPASPPPRTSSTAAGRSGCALVTSGPGAIHLLNGLYDAKLDHQPVVALVGHTALTAEGGGYYQEVDLLALYKDVAAASSPSSTTRRRSATWWTGPAARRWPGVPSPPWSLPLDIQDEPAVPTRRTRTATTRPANAPSSTPTVPPEADLRRAAEVLRGGREGGDARRAGRARRRGRGPRRSPTDSAPGVATALLGFTAVDHREPWVTGAIGLLGTRPSWQLMQDCDRLLIVGSNMPYSEFYPPEGKARAVQIDLDGTQLGLRYPTEVNLTGDAGPTLRALLRRAGRRPRADRVAGGDRRAPPRRGDAASATWPQQAADPVNPQLLFTDAQRPAPRRRDARRATAAPRPPGTPATCRSAPGCSPASPARCCRWAARMPYAHRAPSSPTRTGRWSR